VCESPLDLHSKYFVNLTTGLAVLSRRFKFEAPEYIVGRNQARVASYSQQVQPSIARSDSSTRLKDKNLRDTQTKKPRSKEFNFAYSDLRRPSDSGCLIVFSRLDDSSSERYPGSFKDFIGSIRSTHKDISRLPASKFTYGDTRNPQSLSCDRSPGRSHHHSTSPVSRRDHPLSVSDPNTTTITRISKHDG
jgi:hypothetical protein